MVAKEITKKKILFVKKSDLERWQNISHCFRWNFYTGVQTLGSKYLGVCFQHMHYKSDLSGHK